MSSDSADSAPLTLKFALVSADQLEHAHRLEIQGFPSDEAAELETFRYRQHVAPELFLGAYDGTEHDEHLVGYISSTRSDKDSVTHESMSNHVPEGRTVCIHSICIAESYRRKGVASRLLQEYAERLAPETRILRFALICHRELVPFYESVDFKLVGQSEIIHGSHPWFEMNRPLIMPSHSISSTDLLSALSRPRGSLQQLSYGDLSSEQVQSSDQKNMCDIVCPRPGCQSVILKAGVATHVLKPSHLSGEEWLGSSHLPPLASPPSPVEWWLIEPSPMMFENIAFSKPTGYIIPESGKGMKVLACAECEIGPLGWCEDGSTQFWLVARRVHYQQ